MWTRPAVRQTALRCKRPLHSPDNIILSLSMRTLHALFALLLFSCSAALRAEDAPRPALGSVSATIEFSTGFPAPLTADAALLDSLPRSRVNARDHGVAGTWDGVSFADLLRLAGAPFGEALRGPNLSKYVLVTAADGYRAVFSLGELDTAFGDTSITLAFMRDGQPLPEKEGPFRLVVSGDSKQARWVRQVIRVELFDAPGQAAPPHAH